MYRIVCESYKNYIKDFSPREYDSYRYKVILPFRLIADLNEYEKEKKNNSLDYKKLEDFIWLIKQNIDRYLNFNSLIWSLESRGILGKSYAVLTHEEFNEQVKIMNMFLKLSYWN